MNPRPTDTQVNLYLNGVHVHTHTVLVDSVETVVTFDERLVMPVPVVRNMTHDGVLEARLRGTNMRTQLTMKIQRVDATKGLSCDPSTEHLCRAVNTACTGTPMKCSCDVNTHFWYDRRTCVPKCNPQRQCAPMVAHSTCQSVTSQSVCVCDSPRLHLDGMCVMPECLTELQCELKYGKNSFCQKGYCTCLAGHVLRDGRCSPVECLSNDECMDAHTHCVHGKCVCHGDYDLLKDDCRKGKVGLCPSNTPCAKENTECIRGRCFCKDGYRALQLEQGSPCLKITCDTNQNCSSIRGVCFNGRCSCPDLEPPITLTCPGRSLLSAAEVQTTLKLAVCTLGMVVGMIAFLAMSVMCMKSKEDYESTVDDDELAEDQGALMAAKKVLAAVQEADKDQEPPAEEGALTILMRSFFPNLSRYFFGVHGDEGRISFGDTTVSDSSIDV
ncbi:conserved hypothetical protein [Ixodes scapularis]|uniref:Uncharacterized protein n=1 Tax=Ixodes scapularis TaxID=6945 RepID=B7P8N7_IXOSC|nr:conserved hypothetical protein [Ixodes scapularis]|eukprot:XP_002402521.1 conserved hypothetical protein [Ixodes scapularis]